MCALRLRCKTENGTEALNSLTKSSTIGDLMEKIKLISGVDESSQRILAGFPPKEMNTSDKTQTLESISVQSGDTFTVVNKDKAKEAPQPEPAQKKEREGRDIPGIRRKEVPADNSCLFYSVFYAMEGYLEYDLAKRLRCCIAEAVRNDPDTFSEAVLGKTPYDYSVWIQSDTSWGGAIELSILADIHKVEIAAVDIKSTRLDIYGQEKGYSSRVFLIYDGIHYDPLYFDPCKKGLPAQTIFMCSDDIMLTKVLELADASNKARQFTDTGNFKLVCLTCQKKLTGEKEIQDHAKSTGHGNFSEC